MKELSQKVPLKEKLFYGIGAFYDGGNATLVSLLVLAFFNKGLGIDAGIAGAIIMAAKMWDAISDPLMGNISDNTRSKIGRRRPYLIAGGALIFLSMGLLFAPIVSFSMPLKITFAVFAYIFYCTVSTISQVPYCSLSSEISSDYKERTNANTFKTFFSMIAAGICYLLPSMIFEKYVANQISDVTFWLIMMLGFGAFFAIPLILSGIFVKERVPIVDAKTKFTFKSYLVPFKIKSFTIHLFMYLTAFLCMDIISALAAYYTMDVLRDVTIFGKPVSMIFVIAPMMVVAGCMLPVVYHMMKKRGKAFAYRAFLPLYIVGGVFLAFMPTSAPSIFIPIASIVMGIGFGGAQMLPWLIFPDTLDVAELKLGSRPTGSFSGIMTFVRKFATAIAIFLVGLVLTASGQIAGTEEDKHPIQPQTVLTAIRVVMGISVILLIGSAYIVSSFYKVTDNKLERIRFFLEHQRNGTLSQLTDDEATERAKLIEELADYKKKV